MKLLASWTVAVSLLLSVSSISANNLESPLGSSNTVVRRLTDDGGDAGTYPGGTVVAVQENGVWYFGTTTDYFDGTYTVTWTNPNGSTELEYYDDEDVMAQMVEAAANLENNEVEELYDDGTEVASYFENAGGWWSGEIIDYTDGYYTVQWTDASTDKYAPGQVIDEMVNNAVTKPWNTDAPASGYSVGTEVAQYFENAGGWWSGEIISISDDGYYTVQWTDGSTDKYAAGDTLDEMVNNAATGAWQDDTSSSTYAVGTEVAKYFESESMWYSGMIMSYTDGYYTIQWTDSTTDQYPDGEEMDEMINNVINRVWEDDPNYQAYEVGTAVFKDTDDDEGGWWGVITSFSTGVYYVTWDEDSTKSHFSYSDIKSFVSNAEDLYDNRWQDGTVVYKYFEGDGAYLGEVENYYNGIYTIVWSDGTTDAYSAAAVDTMVADAYEQLGTSSSSKKMSAGGKSGTSLLMICAVVGVGAFVLKRRLLRKDAPLIEGTDSGLENSSYKDHPSTEKKIAELPDII